jgi:hypothetical protein
MNKIIVMMLLSTTVLSYGFSKKTVALSTLKSIDANFAEGLDEVELDAGISTMEAQPENLRLGKVIVESMKAYKEYKKTHKSEVEQIKLLAKNPSFNSSKIKLGLNLDCKVSPPDLGGGFFLGVIGTTGGLCRERFTREEYGYYYTTIGVGLEISFEGHGFLFCALDLPKRTATWNIAARASLLVVEGVSVSLAFGQNGICIHGMNDTGAGASLGVGLLKITKGDDNK